MRIVKFLYKKSVQWGVLDDKTVSVLKEPPFRAVKISKERRPLASVTLCAPAEPSKVVLVGLNYRDHAAELSLPPDPVIFLKPPTALIAHHQTILCPSWVERLDYEAELACVIGRAGRDIPEERAAEYIAGYTCLNDVTARDLQKKDGQWTRAKSFDTFCPVGPWLETAIDPSCVMVSSFLNGARRQHASTSNLIVSVPGLVSFISKVMTLLPGDIISTGTPSGIGPMQDGDLIEIEVEGIGRLANRVRIVTA